MLQDFRKCVECRVHAQLQRNVCQASTDMPNNAGNKNKTRSDGVQNYSWQSQHKLPKLNPPNSQGLQKNPTVISIAKPPVVHHVDFKYFPIFENHDKDKMQDCQMQVGETL